MQKRSLESSIEGLEYAIDKGGYGADVDELRAVVAAAKKTHDMFRTGSVEVINALVVSDAMNPQLSDTGKHYSSLTEISLQSVVVWASQQTPPLIVSDNCDVHGAVSPATDISQEGSELPYSDGRLARPGES